MPLSTSTLLLLLATLLSPLTSADPLPIKRLSPAIEASASAAGITLPEAEATSSSISLGFGGSKTPAQVCTYLATQGIPASQIFLPGSAEYNTQLFHWISSATIPPACVVEPSTTAHVSTLITTFATYNTPFAVKAGGHNANKGFSATTGVQVSLNRFNQVTINHSAGTVTVGPGQTWQQVYNALDGTGLGVTGARVNGPGVGGVILGGGWPWQTQERGLVVDNLVSVQIVVPSGAVVTASATQNTDLFWALKGGGNKFGIATAFTLKTFPQGKVYAGALVYGGDGNMALINQVANAVATWDATNTDVKASMQVVFSWSNTSLSKPQALAVMMYNAPTPPPGTFAIFENIPHVADARQTVSFAAAVAAVSLPPTDRGLQAGLPIFKHTSGYTRAAVADFHALANTPGKSTESVSVVFEPYIPVWKTFSQGGAYPHDAADHNAAPSTSIYVNWRNPSDDAFFQSQAVSLTNSLSSLSISQGCATSLSPVYSNYANYATPLSKMFQNNLPLLQIIKALRDPWGVMNQAGGWAL